MKIVEPKEPGEWLTFADVKPGQVFRLAVPDWRWRICGDGGVSYALDDMSRAEFSGTAFVEIAPDAELHIGRIVSRREVDGVWKEWGGGECPVGPDVNVEVELRDGDVGPATAGSLGWHHYGTDGDIVRYREVPRG